MKNRKLLQLFLNNGWVLCRHGHDHDVWTNGIDQEVIPRHREQNERLAQHLIKKHHLK